MSESKGSLNEELQQFCGTESYTRHGLTRTLMTEGICHMKDTYGLNWLIDTIALHSIRLKHEPFIVWKLTRKDEGSSFNLVATDGNNHILYKWFITYSDCDYDTVEVWAVEQVLLLPSEY